MSKNLIDALGTLSSWVRKAQPALETAVELTRDTAQVLSEKVDPMLGEAFQSVRAHANDWNEKLKDPDKLVHLGIRDWESLASETEATIRKLEISVDTLREQNKVLEEGPLAAVRVRINRIRDSAHDDSKKKAMMREPFMEEQRHLDMIAFNTGKITEREQVIGAEKQNLFSFQDQIERKKQTIRFEDEYEGALDGAIRIEAAKKALSNANSSFSEAEQARSAELIEKKSTVKVDRRLSPEAQLIADEAEQALNAAIEARLKQ